jgi:preprotein translocase subunit SecA
MAGLFSSLFGGNKSEKDVKKITPYVAEINQHFDSYQSITNDELRGKTQVFRQRIKDHLKEIDEEIAGKTKQADELPTMIFLAKTPLPNG